MHFLAQHLHALGCDVVILAPHYAESYEDTIPTQRLGRCFLVNANMATITITFHPKLPVLVRDFTRREQFDVVHTNGPLGWTLPYWALHYSRACNVATFHTAFTGFNLYNVAKIIFKRELQKKIHGVIYPSATAMKTTDPHFSLPYRIIPNGVDTNKFNPTVRPLEKFQDARPRILFLGRLDPRKGLDRLLAAFPLIRQKNPDAQLIVVGSGPLLERYKKSVPRRLREAVLFEGKVAPEIIPRYYASCTVYVSPATGGEVFGIVLTEAMATGKPVVASNIPGYAEVIQNNINGILFDVSDTEDMVHKISAVLQNEQQRDELGKNARIRALQFSWHTVARQVLAYYEELL
jgi:phosphatidylinositol alpha-mannosyltransferase